jgi:hypothetical protein
MDASNPPSIQTPQLFTPNVLLPVQCIRPPATSWLRRLYVAILSDALDCLAGKGAPSTLDSARDRPRRWHEAWQWVMSEAEHCFACVTICAVLELNVEALRREVRHRFAPGGTAHPALPRSLGQLQADRAGHRLHPVQESEQESNREART